MRRIFLRYSIVILLLCSCNSYRVKTHFTSDYKVKNQGKAIVEVHSPIELFHVILALTDVGKQDKYMLRKNTDYYAAVQEKFSKYRNKRIVRLINEKLIQSPHSYHKFVKFFYNYRFKNQDLVIKEELKVSSPYKKYVSLMDDFAKSSNYFEFFENHSDYYKELIEFQKQVVDTKKMWEWLESEFTNRYQCYKTVFSPLTGGNHSTINFSQEDYKETIFFISAPFTQSSNQYYSAQLSGVVFTEIDHNYVNPVSKKNITEIDHAMSERQDWVVENDITKYYKTPYEVFNEYLTHALFCLYASETFDAGIANTVIEKRIELMEKLRGFKEFGAFTSHLLELRSITMDTPIERLYPRIIKWFNNQKTAS